MMDPTNIKNNNNGPKIFLDNELYKNQLSTVLHFA